MYLTEQNRVAILLHEGIQGVGGKTGLTYIRYGKSPIVAIIDHKSAGESLSQLIGINKNIPIVEDIETALKYQPDVLLIGIAPSGGALPPQWLADVEKAIKAGLSIVNGLHTPLNSQFNSLEPGQWIWDIRREPSGLTIGKAKARLLNCQRILTVGTDMSVGKMSTCLELDLAAKNKGIKSKFLGTGQAGIMISGHGIPLDAIRVDFAAGAVEQMVLNAGDNYQVLWIEGQGSLLHPGSTATLPLIRGSQPTSLILVHRAGQTHIKDLPEIVIPPLSQVVEMYEIVASAYGTFSPVKVKAIALNTFHLDRETAEQAITKVQEETGLPCSDVIRFGANSFLNAVLWD